MQGVSSYDAPRSPLPEAFCVFRYSGVVATLPGAPLPTPHRCFLTLVLRPGPFWTMVLSCVLLVHSHLCVALQRALCSSSSLMVLFMFQKAALLFQTDFAVLWLFVSHRVSEFAQTASTDVSSWTGHRMRSAHGPGSLRVLLFCQSRQFFALTQIWVSTDVGQSPQMTGSKDYIGMCISLRQEGQ